MFVSLEVLSYETAIVSVRRVQNVSLVASCVLYNSDKMRINCHILYHLLLLVLEALYSSYRSPVLRCMYCLVGACLCFVDLHNISFDADDGC